MNSKLYIVFLVLVLSACSTTSTFSGKVMDSNGQPLGEIEVQFWQNQWIPFHLPERVAQTTTDANGKYSISIKKRVSFIIYEDSPITFSKSIKPDSGTINHYHEIEVPKI